MKGPKEYTVTDLFYTSWDDLTAQARTEVYALYHALQEQKKGSIEYGLHLIQIMRRLRKNFRLVNKINESQTVDIFNDLTFFEKSWYKFPNLTYKLITPEDQLVRHTFDHFIYADHEFTCYQAKPERKYLVQLVCALYKQKGDGEYLDRQVIDDRAMLLAKKIKDWELQCVFFTYMHVRGFVMSRCKTLFPKQKLATVEGEEPLAEQKVIPTGPRWLQLKHRLAETRAFPGLEKAERANMYSALDYLEDIAQQNSKK